MCTAPQMFQSLGLLWYTDCSVLDVHVHTSLLLLSVIKQMS